MVQVKIGNCTINGLHKKNIDVFLGIPYAKPFNKISRFQHSKFMELSKPMIDATHIRSIPPQPYNSLEDFFSMTDSSFNSFKQNDYCLFLNIWKPSSNQNHLPVVIYFYGGSFLQGHGTAELYCPEHIVEQENIIVVTFNYRLGALGYLDWSYFNQHLNYNNGISDQINVLRWVHQYIEHFGGDSNNVTLMGQSAGSMSIMTLMQMPELDDYYHKVMLLSGTLTTDTPLNAHTKVQHFSQLMRHYFPNKTLKTLTSDDILYLMESQKIERGRSRGLDLIYQPIKDHHMSRSIKKFPKPTFMSYTHDEGDIYIEDATRTLPSERFIHLMSQYGTHVEKNDALTMKQQRNLITEYCFVRPIYLFLNQMNSCDTWLARFDWHQPHTSYFKSAYHILDLVFWFGHLSILTKNHYSITQHDMNLSSNMISDLAYFARKGKMPWKCYEPQHQALHIYG